MTERLYPVLLSGGPGSRLWPLSRQARPKQFLPLTTSHSILQDTVERITSDAFAAPTVICAHDHRFLVATQLQEIGVHPREIILESCARNTAAAVVVAALNVLEEDPDGVLLVLPADHIVGDEETFSMSVSLAATAARKGHLATLGIQPERPHTGFGYIRKGAGLPGHKGVYVIEEFREKPNAESAASMLKEGGWLWNSGMFVFPASEVVRQMKAFMPQLVADCRDALAKAYRDLDFLRLGAESYARMENISIDKGLMERTEDAVVVPVTGMGWNDIGSWQALWDIAEKDDNGNALNGDAILRDVKHCYIRSDGPLVVGIGVSDLVVVVDDDVVLVSHKDHAQHVKGIVLDMQRDDRREAQQHSIVYRPWGHYRLMEQNEGFKVKKISVHPGKRLSLQRHQNRAEHWVVVKGTAYVIKGDETFSLYQNQSTYITAGEFHRIENHSEDVLELIEVQVGNELSEDDIERLADDFGRNVE